MNTAHVILRTLIVTWGVLLVVMATLLALYLIERGNYQVDAGTPGSGHSGHEPLAPAFPRAPVRVDGLGEPSEDEPESGGDDPPPSQVGRSLDSSTTSGPGADEPPLGRSVYVRALGDDEAAGNSWPAAVRSITEGLSRLPSRGVADAQGD